MGKPIAGRNKSPFGVAGIVVDAAHLSNGTLLTNVRISKQRSSHMFDLISLDGLTVYSFVKISGQDSSGVNLSPSLSAGSLASALGAGTFCVKIKDSNAQPLGYAVKFLLNKITLQDSTTVYISDYLTLADNSIHVTGVTLNKTTSAILSGATEQLTATVAPSNATNKAVTWASATPSVATVNSSGLVTAVANGTAVITVTTADGAQTASCTYTVTTAVASVTVAPTTATLSLAGTTTQQLTPTVLPANASVKTVTYVSSAPAVATVNSSGLVTAVTVGTATITVTTTSGAKTATAVITVTA